MGKEGRKESEQISVDFEHKVSTESLQHWKAAKEPS